MFPQAQNNELFGISLSRLALSQTSRGKDRITLYMGSVCHCADYCNRGLGPTLLPLLDLPDPTSLETTPIPTDRVSLERSASIGQFISSGDNCPQKESSVAIRPKYGGCSPTVSLGKSDKVQ
jgi:hypothetical protein